MKSETIDIDARNIDPRIVERLRGISSITEVASFIEDASSMRGTIKIHATDAKDAIPEMLGVLVKEGVEISNVKVAEPTLEDVFISLTGRALRD
jgi:ABC-2 type transport system ATP-binding protein